MLNNICQSTNARISRTPKQALYRTLLNRLNLSKIYICPTPTSPNPGSSAAAVKIIDKQATILLRGLEDTRNYVWWLGCKDIRVCLDRDQDNQMCVSVYKLIMLSNKHKSPPRIDINNKQQLMQDFPGNSKWKFIVLNNYPTKLELMAWTHFSFPQYFHWIWWPNVCIRCYLNLQLLVRETKMLPQSQQDTGKIYSLSSPNFTSI